MRKPLLILLTAALFISACSKKATTNPTTPPVVVVTPPAPAGTVTTVAGTGLPGMTNAKGNLASFSNPTGLTVDAYDYVTVADVDNNMIRQVDPYGGVTTLAGSGLDSLANGTGAAASFAFPNGVVIDSKGNIYVADSGNNLIREVTEAGVATTFAGGGATSPFNSPIGIAVDANDNIYVANAGDNRILEVSASGVITTLAGSGKAGYADGAGTAASFNFPNGVAVDANGNVYVADLINRLIRKITPGGVVSTFAGDGAVSFKAPAGVAVDANGNIFVADEGTNLISMITPAGVITTLAGSGAAGFKNGLGTAATFNFPTGVAVDLNGNVYVADKGNQAIRKISSGK